MFECDYVYKLFGKFLFGKVGTTMPLIIDHFALLQQTMIALLLRHKNFQHLIAALQYKVHVSHFCHI